MFGIAVLVLMVKICPGLRLASRWSGCDYANVQFWKDAWEQEQLPSNLKP